MQSGFAEAGRGGDECPFRQRCACDGAWTGAAGGDATLEVGAGSAAVVAVGSGGAFVGSSILATGTSTAGGALTTFGGDGRRSANASAATATPPAAPATITRCRRASRLTTAGVATVSIPAAAATPPGELARSSTTEDGVAGGINLGDDAARSSIALRSVNLLAPQILNQLGDLRVRRGVTASSSATAICGANGNRSRGSLASAFRTTSSSAGGTPGTTLGRRLHSRHENRRR